MTPTGYHRGVDLSPTHLRNIRYESVTNFPCLDHRWGSAGRRNEAGRPRQYSIGRAVTLASLRAGGRSNDLVGHIIAVPLDVTDNDGVRAVYERIFAEHGVPDLCVLNAGTYIPTDGAIFSADAFAGRSTLTLWVSSALDAIIPSMVSRRADGSQSWGQYRVIAAYEQQQPTVRPRRR